MYVFVLYLSSTSNNHSTWPLGYYTIGTFPPREILFDTTSVSCPAITAYNRLPIGNNAYG